MIRLTNSKHSRLVQVLSNRQQDLPVTRKPIVVALDADESERVLAPHRLRRFYLLLVPLLLSFISCGAGGWLIFDAQELPIAGILLIFFGMLLAAGYFVFETFFIGVIPARSYLHWLRERIDQRPDAVVAADDPEAFFVQHIPHKNWNVNIGENASDVGLLLLDHQNGLMKYEGDVERWIIPAECIGSLRLDSFTPSAGIDFLNRHTVVMLRIEADNAKAILRPLAVHPLYWRPWTPGAREEGARQLREAIRHFVDPEKWPRPFDEDLDLLIPPPN